MARLLNCNFFWAEQKCLLRAALPFSPCPLLASLAAPSAPAAPVYQLVGRVVSIADGDTIALLTAGNNQHRVRLANIDAPETGHGQARPGQPYGQNARQALAQLLAGKTVRAQCYQKDRYGRDICDILLAHTTASAEMVR